MAASAEVSSELLDPRALARLKGLVLRARRVVDGVLQGVHRSPHHGSSIEFSEHKEYSPGDEIKHIDWKAFGRLDKYYVKKFEQESNLRAFFLIDASKSMAYGRSALSKFDYASVLSVSLAHLLLRQQDACGVVTFADKVLHTLPPRARSGHLSHMCAALEGTSPDGATKLEAGLEGIIELARKRGMIFVMSDFFGESERAFRLMRQLVGRGHEVTVLHVLDGDELDFPFEEMTLFEGMESKRRLLVEPRLVRDEYLKKMAAHREHVRVSCLGAQITHLHVDTREPPDRLLLRYVTRRA